MNRQIAVLFGVWVLLAGLTAQVSAELPTGTKAPEITATDWLNTPPLTLEKLRGRIVVVEFWATWCGPCRATIPHLIELHKQYGPKGVVLCSLTDESKSKVEPFAREMGMIYAVGCGSKSGGAYGVRGIPHAFIVDPTGVIAWHGHPAGGLDAAIEKQLKATPPTLLSEKERAAATALLENVEALMQKERYAAALAMLGKLKRPDADPKIAAHVAQIRARLTAQAEAALKDAQKQIQAEQYYEASLALGRAMALAADTPQGAEARKQFQELYKNDDARAAIEQGKREKEAADLLAAIEKAKTKKTPAATLDAYDDLANRFPGTKAGATAADKAKAMRADPDLMAQMKNAAAEKDCKGWLSMARNFMRAGLQDKAKPYLDKVITTYPGTDFAKEAKAMLAKMEK